MRRPFVLPRTSEWAKMLSHGGKQLRLHCLRKLLGASWITTKLEKKRKITYRWCLTGVPPMSTMIAMVSCCPQTLWNTALFRPWFTPIFFQVIVDKWLKLSWRRSRPQWYFAKVQLLLKPDTFFASTLPRLALYLNITRPEDIKY